MAWTGGTKNTDNMDPDKLKQIDELQLRDQAGWKGDFEALKARLLRRAGADRSHGQFYIRAPIDSENGGSCSDPTLDGVLRRNKRYGLGTVVLYCDEIDKGSGVFTYVPGKITCARSTATSATWHVLELADGDIHIMQLTEMDSIALPREGPVIHVPPFILVEGAKMHLLKSGDKWKVNLGEGFEQRMVKSLRAFTPTLKWACQQALTLGCRYMGLVSDLVPELQHSMAVFFAERAEISGEQRPDLDQAERDAQSFRLTCIDSLLYTLIPHLHEKIREKLQSSNKTISSPLKKLSQIGEDLRVYRSLLDLLEVLQMPWDYVSRKTRQKICRGLHDFRTEVELVKIFSELPSFELWRRVLAEVHPERVSVEAEFSEYTGGDSSCGEEEEEEETDVSSNSASWLSGTVIANRGDGKLDIKCPARDRIYTVSVYDVRYAPDYFRPGMTVCIDTADDTTLQKRIQLVTDTRLILEDQSKVSMSKVYHPDMTGAFQANDRVEFELPTENESPEEKQGMLSWWRGIFSSKTKAVDHDEVVAAAVERLRKIPEEVRCDVFPPKIRRMAHLQTELFTPRTLSPINMHMLITDFPSDGFPHPRVTKENIAECEVHYVETCMEFMDYDGADWDDKERTRWDDNEHLVDPDYTPDPKADRDVQSEKIDEYFNRINANANSSRVPLALAFGK